MKKVKKKRAKKYETKLAINMSFEDVLKIAANHTPPKYLKDSEADIALTKEDKEVLNEQKERLKKLNKISKEVKGGKKSKKK